ncbi:MAG TPA: 4-(cytidine 5'-diphospho)-2-C-methyl-D-erythritol kinase [Armatimonadota bacterium]|jgi:4-diphosphocytidyl-2-C-methyl-D-erythritol kinase
MTVTALAPAKINLTLEILGSRADGYHELRSVMQAISLHDTLTLEDAPGEGIIVSGGSPDAPPDESNLVYRAATALAGAAGVEQGARIALRKRIPVGAGLGGGSSDAATALLALNKLWCLDWPAVRLAEIGATLGSDVPFFLTGGTALAEGRGETLTELLPPAQVWLVVVWPGVKLPTPRVYRRYDESAAGVTRALDRSRQMVSALLANSAEGLGACLQNDLEAAAFGLAAPVQAAKERLVEAGAVAASMSGSGSSVYGLARDERHAGEIAERIRPAGYWTSVCHTVPLPYEGES